MLIAQFSDIHLRARGQLYKGLVDSNRLFAEAIEHLAGFDTAPDLVLLTGDLVDEGSPAEYAMVRDMLDVLPWPWLVLPGNHDEREAMRIAFADQPYLPRSGPLHFCVDTYPVRIVALDSCVAHAHHGALDADALDWLARTLARPPLKPTVLALHHPPLVSGIPYMDRYRLLDPEPLARLLARYENIEAVLFGHVHRMMAGRWAGTIALGCPSTATQIALALDSSSPAQSWLGPRAYMLHRWRDGEGLVSHEVPLGDWSGPLPFI